MWQPFTPLCLLALLAVANLWRGRRESRVRLLLVTLPFAALVLVCLPVVSNLCLWSLECWSPPLKQRPPGVEAIIVLGGGVQPTTPWQEKPELSEGTYFRCQGAMDLYRR